MQVLAPWTGVTSLRKEMDRLFGRFFVAYDHLQ